MTKESASSVLVKAEADFFAALETCPTEILSAEKGICRYREGNALYLEVTSSILDSTSRFGQYLALPSSQKVFGFHNPLFADTAVKYVGNIPVKLNHFNTRLLLAFFEVQLALGFTGSVLRRHLQDLDSCLQGSQVRLMTNYYHPFTHEDNVGIHYVLNHAGRPGYSSQDWQNFIQYSQTSMQAAFQVSPSDFGATESGLHRKQQEYRQLVSDAYLATGILNNPPIRHLGILIHEVLSYKGGPAACFVPNPRSRQPMKYIPFMDCLLDMPYQPGTLIIFQSICAGK